MRVRVFGPAYVDRVLRLDGPLAAGVTIDRSAEGRFEDGPSDSLAFTWDDGAIITKPMPEGWPGPSGRVRLTAPGLTLTGTTVRAGLSWHDDLGGMGAGFAAALRGELRVVLGDQEHPTTRTGLSLLKVNNIESRPVFRPGRSSDWTLLVTSGPFGDKLAVGLRGALRNAPAWPDEGDSVDLLLVASMTNRLAESASLGPAVLRVLAPSLRNMLDRDPPLAEFASRFQVLCCNREEWLACAERDIVAEGLDLLVITEGPRGSTLRFHGPSGSRVEVIAPAFPRANPPLDTNRAGEAFAATLLQTLWNEGWRGGGLDEDLARRAATHAAAAAALVLDRDRFGFPEAEEVDAALRAGVVS